MKVFLCSLLLTPSHLQFQPCKLYNFHLVYNFLEEKNKDAFRKVLKSWQEKLTTINLLGGDYKQLPASALISMQNDNNTTYNTYLQVQNELQSAVNELRDELALSKFGVSYRELEEVYGKNKQDKTTLEKITAVRALYPQRISEAEPRDAGATYY